MSRPWGSKSQLSLRIVDRQMAKSSDTTKLSLYDCVIIYHINRIIGRCMSDHRPMCTNHKSIGHPVLLPVDVFWKYSHHSYWLWCPGPTSLLTHVAKCHPGNYDSTHKLYGGSWEGIGQINVDGTRSAHEKLEQELLDIDNIKVGQLVYVNKCEPTVLASDAHKVATVPYNNPMLLVLGRHNIVTVWEINGTIHTLTWHLKYS